MFDYKKTDDNSAWCLWFLMLGPGILVLLLDQFGFATVLGICSGIGVFSELLNLWVVDLKYQSEIVTIDDDKP
jgi:hypothetical protein